MAGIPSLRRSPAGRGPKLAAGGIVVGGAVMLVVRATADIPLGAGEAIGHVVLTGLAAVVAFYGVRAWRRPPRPAMHVEYTLHAELDGTPPTLAQLLERLAALGRNVAVRALDELGEPGETAPPPGAPLVGSQVQLRLAADTGPGRVLLRLRRDGERELFGLIEIDDDGSWVVRRFAGDVVRELGVLVPGLGYARPGNRSGVAGQLVPAANIEAGEAL